MNSEVIRLENVSVVRGGIPLLDDISWSVGAGERWALLGPNGSGKTTLLKVVGSALWPTRGVVEILGERLGRVDMRELRSRIAVVSASVGRTLRPELARPRRGADRPPCRPGDLVARVHRRRSGPGPVAAGRAPGSAAGRSPSDRSACCPRASANRSCWPGR